MVVIAVLVVNGTTGNKPVSVCVFLYKLHREYHVHVITNLSGHVFWSSLHQRGV